MNGRIRFRHLHCFLAIARHQNVGAAAKELAITQPALSKTLREIEDELQVQLFERGRRGMSLTQFGDLFLQHASASIASLRHGVDSINLARAASAQAIAVGALPNVAARLMPEAVRIFKDGAAGTVVRLVDGSNSRLLDRLRLGDLELVVGRLASTEHLTGLAFEHLYFETLAVVVRRQHPLAKTKRVRPASLVQYPWLLPEEGTVIRQEIDRFAMAEGIPRPANKVESTSVPFGRAYVEKSDVIWFVPNGAVMADLAARSLKALPISSSTLNGPVGITTRLDIAPTAAGRLFIEAVRRAAAGLDIRS
jgi:LysR family pca operon transcriptional activator